MLILYFSPWIILWSILYYLKLIKYNPLIMLFCITLFTMIIITCLLYNNVNLLIVFYYSLIVLLPKVIMILLLDNDNILEGFYVSIIFFCVYLLFITWYQTNLYNLYYINSYNKIINTKLTNFNEFIFKYFFK
jgi:hypothetical protein